MPLRSGILVFFAVLAKGGAAVLRLCGATAPPAFAATRDEGGASAAARAALTTLPPFALTGVGRVRGRRWVVLAMRDGRRRRTGPALCVSPEGGACSAWMGDLRRGSLFLMSAHCLVNGHGQRRKEGVCVERHKFGID